MVSADRTEAPLPPNWRPWPERDAPPRAAGNPGDASRGPGAGARTLLHLHRAHPFAWQTVAARKGDLIFIPSKPPTTITVAGFIGSLDNLRREAQPENPWAITVEQEDGTLVPTVIARLSDGAVGYYLWLELHPDRPFGNGDNPGLILYGFDPRAAKLLTSATEMVAVWSVAATEAAARAAQRRWRLGGAAAIAVRAAALLGGWMPSWIPSGCAAAIRASAGGTSSSRRAASSSRAGEPPG
jgi:hypothetical protein